MKEGLQILKDGLIERWVKAHAEIKDIPAYEAKVSSYKYALNTRYDVRDFKAGKFKAGGKMFVQKPLDDYDYYEYGFDKKGLPVTEKFSHTFNKVDWVGIYKVEREFIEHIEFCTTTSVVSAIQRVNFDKGKKLSGEYFALNGKTASLIDINQPLKNIGEFIHANRDFFIYHIQEFVYADKNIVKAYGVVNSPGIGEYLYEDVYTYDSSNILEKIVRYFDNGRQVIEYSKPLIKGVKNLTAALATNLSDYLIDFLKAQNFEIPLFNVQLNYRYYDSYMPTLMVINEQQRNAMTKADSNELFFSGEFFLAVENRPPHLEALYAEFNQLMQKTDNWQAGRKMLWQTALLMNTSKLKGLVPVSDDFIAFAIEWVMDAQELEKILVRCGASRANIKEWKKHGWV